MPFQLVVLRGRSNLKHHRLGPGVTVVGRQEGCQLQIKSSQVSRKHCELFERDGRLIVKDLNSSNGTFVNGQRIQGQRVLAPGDELSIGGVKFRVEPLGAGAPAASSPGDTAVAAAISPEASAVATDEDAIPLSDVETILETPGEPAASSPPQRPGPAAQPERQAEEVTELGEDAVAEFLMDLNLDEDDKS